MDIYWAMVFVSMVMMTGDSDNFGGWIIWEIGWFVMFLFCWFMISKHDKHDGKHACRLDIEEVASKVNWITADDEEEQTDD